MDDTRAGALARARGLDRREAAQLLRDADRAGGESAGWLPLDANWRATRRAAGRHLATSVQYAQHMGGATTELVERLLAYGASPNERVRANTQGSNGHWIATPLHWAARFGHENGLAVARALVAAGADIHAKVKNIGAEGRPLRWRHRRTPLAWADAASRCSRPVQPPSALGPHFRAAMGGER